MELQKHGPEHPQVKLWKDSNSALITALTAASQPGFSDEQRLALQSAASRLLPKTVQTALDSPVLKDLVREIGEDSILRAIEYELMVLNELVGCTNRLSNIQIVAIAEQLLATYPNESLADFKICFMRATIGQYNNDKNKVVWLDGIVIGQWVGRYLSEKYDAVEARLMAEKDNPYDLSDKKAPPFDLLAEFKRVHGIDLTEKTRIPRLTRDQILEQGQSEPPRRSATGARPMTAEEVEAWHLEKESSKIAWENTRLEKLRKKYPDYPIEELRKLL